MARTFLNSILSFLSTAVFFATFLLAGDVLTAAVVATATAIVQFFIRRAQHRSAVLLLASLAIVFALTGLSLKGDDAYAATLPQAHVSEQTRAHVTPCSCRAALHATEAKLTAAPLL
ncbi:MAG: hypothetical protein HY242_06085 [Afipia sp.]|nr:hypothetical protein [Afipia sp.]